MIRADMLGAGVDPDRMPGGARFVEAFAPVDLAGHAGRRITVLIRQEPGLPGFMRMPDGNVHINIAEMLRYPEAPHALVRYIVDACKRHHADATFLLDWRSLDLYLDNIFRFDEVKRIHHMLGLFDFFNHQSFGRGMTAHCGFAPLVLDDTPRFYARPGKVELRAARTLTRHPEALDGICAEIAANWDSHEFMYRPNTSSDTEVGDLGYTIRQLITNAGMYGTDGPSLAASLRAWGNRYLSGLYGAHELYVDWVCSMHSHVVRVAALEAGLSFRGGPRAMFPSIDTFYRYMEGRTVLMISPFAPACLAAMERGTIKRIWKTRQVPEFSLVGITAHITTYPNRPHASWADTFARLCDEVDAIVAEREIGLVVGSCGGYGIPLLDYCHKRHGLNSVYYGNFMHAFFGLRQRDFGWLMREANEEAWLDPFIGMGDAPPNLELIDAGRYMRAG